MNVRVPEFLLIGRKVSQPRLWWTITELQHLSLAR